MLALNLLPFALIALLDCVVAEVVQPTIGDRPPPGLLEQLAHRSPASSGLQRRDAGILAVSLSTDDRYVQRVHPNGCLQQSPAAQSILHRPSSREYQLPRSARYRLF